MKPKRGEREIDASSSVSLSEKEFLKKFKGQLRKGIPESPHNPSQHAPQIAREIPIRYIPGVGPRIAEIFAGKGIQTAEDLLYYFPYKYLDRRKIDKIGGLKPGPTSVVGKIVSSGLVFFGRNRRRMFEVLLADASGAVSLKWFHFYPGQMKARFQKGSALVVSGDVAFYRGEPQFVHPQVEFVDPDLVDEIQAPGIISNYSQIQGLGQRTLRKIIKNALSRVVLVDPIPDEIRERRGLIPKGRSLQEIHSPNPEISFEDLNNARSEGHRREIFEEFFFMELGLALKRSHTKKESGVSFKIESNTRAELERGLPFELTSAQKRVLNEIFVDMKQATPMNRLIQGDVGSGKTVVALLAALAAIQNGYQVALMAPTEILAEQHAKTFQKILGSFKIPYALLKGSLPAAQKSKIRSKLRRGLYSLVIGTHAIISDGVDFKNLGLAIIDEQHRFGVMQRAALKEKGKPDIIVMTATPIPRTLAMTVYGDLDLSIIDEMPPGRQPIKTAVIESANRRGLYATIRDTLDKGEQGYVVYPLIEESEKLPLKDATRMCAELKKIFPNRRLALLHGKIKTDEKEAIFKKFRAGEIDLLISTTVIEVGVDVANATLMVIEHANRFGLSQLHQLRGRVGRSEKASRCLLVSDYRKTEEAYKRLKVMTQTQDGFRIAEEDLKIRGAGDFLGTRQSGLPDLRVANLLRDHAILRIARDDAFKLISKDTDLLGHPILKSELLRKWSEKLALAEVG